jgi:hypothetical protein
VVVVVVVVGSGGRQSWVETAARKGIRVEFDEVLEVSGPLR